MRDVLKTRAKELAGRHKRREKAPTTELLVARWETATWGFPLHPFSALREGHITLLPPGSRLDHLPLWGLILHETSVIPIVDWATLVGLSEYGESTYAISPEKKIAIRLPHSCQIEDAPIQISPEAQGQFCKGTINGIQIAHLAGFF